MKSHDMKLILNSALLISLALCVGPVAKAQNTESKDVEYTGAFLVKLKPDVTTRAGVDDGWKLTPLMTETTSRGETRPAGGWYYLAPQSGVSTHSSSDATASQRRPKIRRRDVCIRTRQEYDCRRARSLLV